LASFYILYILANNPKSPLSYPPHPAAPPYEELLMANRVFKVALIKPSHYDAAGYVIQWRRSMIPSNSLASVYGIISDCDRRHVLGEQTRIEIEAYDECNWRINVRKLARKIRAAGAGFVGLVGVQSNQYPRALDLGRQFRAAGVPVVIGGFHVSGSLSMLPEITPELQQALDLGISLFAGEAETRMTGLLRDIDRDELKPIYNYLAELPSLEGAPPPMLPSRIANRVATNYTTFDGGRGCPFQCSFCTIINVQGRKSRYRTADDVEGIVRDNAAQGITRFFVTDDNFARNKNWEAIFDRLATLQRVDGFKIRLILQVDTLCHRIPNFIEKAVRAGCTSVFIGLESINPETLIAAKKRQNKIWEYREMLLAWKRAKVMTYAGYILGFPHDTPTSIARDIEIIKRELPIDLLEFFVLTPLPGSEDHKNLYLRDVAMDPDLNNYDLEHVCTAHPSMSREELAVVYDKAWAQYYTDEHVETIMRRAVVTGVKDSKIIKWLYMFSGTSRIAGVHPLQVGILRRKVRKDRRSGMPVVHPFIFYPCRTYEVLKSGWQWLRLIARYRNIHRRVLADPSRMSYTDEALQARSADEDRLVEAFADKIPRTYGAPKRHAAVAT
jgi:radical SAM superfamily enzyme YgiQ (UPF0313 family)